MEVKGYILKDEIITLEKGSKVSDLLNNINIYDDTDLSRLSLNDVLYDGEIIVFTKIDNNLISINNANEKQLQLLPGIGLSIAKRIIEYRLEYGSFNSLEELMNVKGIGEKKYEKIKEFICL